MNKTLRFCGNTFSAKSIQKSKCRALDKKILLKWNYATVQGCAISTASLPEKIQCILVLHQPHQGPDRRRILYWILVFFLHYKPQGSLKATPRSTKKEMVFNVGLLTCRNLCYRMVILNFYISKWNYWTNKWESIKDYLPCQVYQKYVWWCKFWHGCWRLGAPRKSGHALLSCVSIQCYLLAAAGTRVSMPELWPQRCSRGSGWPGPRSHTAGMGYMAGSALLPTGTSTAEN